MRGDILLRPHSSQCGDGYPVVSEGEEERGGREGRRVKERGGGREGERGEEMIHRQNSHWYVQ